MRDTAVRTMAQQRTGNDCSRVGRRGTRCRLVIPEIDLNIFKGMFKLAFGFKDH